MSYQYLQAQASKLVCSYISNCMPNVTVQVKMESIPVIHIVELNITTSLEELFNVVPVDQFKYDVLVNELLPSVSRIYGMEVVFYNQIIRGTPYYSIKFHIQDNSYVKYNDNLGIEIVSRGVYHQVNENNNIPLYDVNKSNNKIVFSELCEYGPFIQILLLQFLVDPVNVINAFGFIGVHYVKPNNMLNIAARINAKTKLYEHFLSLCYICNGNLIILDVVRYIFGILIALAQKPQNSNTGCTNINKYWEHITLPNTRVKLMKKIDITNYC